MYKLISLILFYQFIYICSGLVEESYVYNMPLFNGKLTYNTVQPNSNLMNYQYPRKTSPTNENITLFKYLDSEYYAEILVGRPGQKFKVIFDTTFGDMWLPSKLCSKDLYPFCSTRNLYDGSASSTHKSIDPKPFEIPGLVGNLTCDAVRLAHLNVSDLVFAEIREIADISDFRNMHADGVIGLAFKPLARTTDNPFFYKLLADKKIKKPIFSLYINRDRSTNKGGIIFLGGIEPKHISGDITYVPVTTKYYWQIKIDQFTITKHKTVSNTFCDSTCQVILDSSTNKIGMPKKDVLLINTFIGAEEYYNNTYKVSCLNISKLPIITVKIGDRDFYMKGRHYVQQVEGSNGLICITAFYETELPNGVWTLGGAFLSSVYTIFDLENRQVGIANLKSG